MSGRGVKRAIGTGLGLATLAALAAAPAAADVVELRSGGRLEGVVVQQTENTVVVEASPGRVTLPRSQVVRVVPTRSPLQVWRDRAASLSGRDVQGWVALARWAEDAGLGTQARESWERVLSANPGNVEANEALHRMQVNGRWVSEEEGYRARGWVNYEGQWMSPAEHEIRARERAAADAEDQQRREQRLRMREAEARVQEAEARAHGMATMGGGGMDGYGYGYGYGGYYGAVNDPYHTNLSPYYGNPNEAFYANAFYGNYPWGTYFNYGSPRFRGQGFGFGGPFVTPFPKGTISGPLAPPPGLSPRQRNTLIIGPTTGPGPAGVVGAGGRH